MQTSPEITPLAASVEAATTVERDAASALERATAELVIAERAFVDSDQSDKAYAPVEKARRARDRIALVHEGAARALRTATATRDAAARAILESRLAAAREVATSLPARVQPKAERLAAMLEEVRALALEVRADVVTCSAATTEAMAISRDLGVDTGLKNHPAPHDARAVFVRLFEARFLTPGGHPDPDAYVFMNAFPWDTVASKP